MVAVLPPRVFRVLLLVCPGQEAEGDAADPHAVAAHLQPGEEVRKVQSFRFFSTLTGWSPGAGVDDRVRVDVVAGEEEDAGSGRPGGGDAGVATTRRESNAIGNVGAMCTGTSTSNSSNSNYSKKIAAAINSCKYQ